MPRSLLHVLFGLSLHDDWFVDVVQDTGNNTLPAAATGTHRPHGFP
jgi:hypothetical protein